MAEPVSHTLHYLRKVDRDVREFRDKVERDIQKIRAKVDRNYELQHRRLNGLQLGLQGQTFSDQCAIARFDQRISALEKRASRPRKPK
jgi:hypothetical protein